MRVGFTDWRAAAEQLRATHPVFEHLGAREIQGDRWEVWLVVSTSKGQPQRLATEICEGDVLPSLADLWAGAAWCEREASEGYRLSIGATDLLLLVAESERGVLRRQRFLEPRQQPWPGSHEPSGRSRLTPMGRDMRPDKT